MWLNIMDNLYNTVQVWFSFIDFLIIGFKVMIHDFFSDYLFIKKADL
jgi:hypothetical protein